MSATTKAEETINKINDELGVGWDIDSTLVLMGGFIDSLPEKLQKEFEARTRAIGEEEKNLDI